MIKCPNKTLPEWKELVKVVGENQAYYLWDQNNGYGLDKTPNGQPSKLFSDLLSHYNGDRNAAIQAKAKVYSEAFKNWFGDWLSADKTNVSKVVDENQEPKLMFRVDYPNRDVLGNNEQLFATDKLIVAGSYASENSELYKGFISIKNPYFVREEAHGFFLNYQGKETSIPAIQDTLIADGYDGVIYDRVHDVGDYADFDPEIDYWASNVVMFNANQIKSIDNQGTFSTQDNSIYHSLNNEDVHEIFRKQHLIHKFNNRWFINKDQYNSTEQLEAITDSIIQKSYEIGYEVRFISKPLSTAVLFVRRDLQDTIPQSPDYTHVREIIAFLCDRFPGLKFGGVVSQNEAKPNQRAFIKDDTIYLVEGRFTDQIAIEEAIHPFINTLYHTNRSLFDSLYKEISSRYPKLKSDIERNYSEFDTATKQQELVAQAFSRAFYEQYKSSKPSKLKDVLHKFIEWLRQLFTTDVISTYDQINYINSSKLPTMTLTELVQLIHTTNTKFDVDFNGTFNNLSEQQTKEVNKTYSRIQQGLKDRLKSVKRYSTKNPKLWRQLQTVINQLANSEAEQGILQFLQHVSDTIGEASVFLQKPIDQINAKQIRQLSQDYVGFYKPLLDEIIYLTDTTDLFKTLPNYNDLVANMQVLSTNMNQIYNRFSNVLKSKGKSELQAYLQQNGMPQEYIDKTLQWLDDPTVDSSIFLNWFGMASNSNNAVLQAIAKLLNDTMNGTERETMAKGIELVKVLQEAKDKYGIDVQELLYEKLKDGTYSGYIVKPINYGQYRKDKEEYLDKLAEKLGITKDQDGYYDIPTDEDIANKWYEGVNDFYSRKVNRRFTPEYYKLRNEYLSNTTRQAIDEIQNYIDSIISSVTRDGVIYENELTASEYEQLLQLRKQKRLLANPYNLDGSMKTGTDGQIAEELRKFNEAIGNQDYVTNWDKYNKDLAKVIARYGSKNDPRVKQWIARNTTVRFTQEFSDRLDALNKIPQSKLYNELVERRRKLRQLFNDPHTNQITAEKLSDSERALLLQLDKDIEAERVRNKSENEVGDKFSLFAEVIYTDEYYRDYKQAQNAGTQAFNDWYWKNHYENQYGDVVPASYYTRLQPKDMNKYSETVPTGRYSTIDASSKWFNKDFDQSGPAIQPKKEFYDNSKAYKEVMSKPEIKALYDAVVATMQEANSFIPFLNNLDDGRMPQIPARLMQIINRQSSIMQSLSYVWDEVATTQPDDLDFVEEVSTMPNGDPIKIIPTRFIKMLKDTNTISTDAISSVIAYYHMASNFRNMQQNQDQIELLLNLLRNVQVRNRKGVKPAGSSNIYKQAQLLVDRLMYGRNMTPITVEVGSKEINVSKMANEILELVRKTNLSGNIWSIATSFFTDSTYTTLEAKLGRFFDMNDLQFAISEFQKQFPDMLNNVGNPTPNGKLPFLLQLNQVVKDNQEIFNRLDQSQVLRSLNQNFWYAGYTQSDYLVKSHILLSVYHNYKLVDGKFLSKNEYLNQYYPNDRKAGEVAFKQLKTTLYDAYNEDGSVKKEYEKAINTQLLNKVKNRIDVLSRRIDGTLRSVDKAAIHAHALAQYIVLHKNFMISGLHDRFKKRQFNLDTGVEEEGYYRTTANFLKGVVGNKHFSLKQILADYDQLKDYEQYAISRVLHEMMLFTAATALAVSLVSLVDGDDDYDNWLTQSITYLALRSAFEFRTMYNPFEFMSMIKSPTAAFTWFDNASSMINLFNPFSYIGKGGPFKIIDRGVYEGMPRILRNIIKVTPIRSIIEAADPESKRSYLQNQLMTF